MKIKLSFIVFLLSTIFCLKIAAQQASTAANPIWYYIQVKGTNSLIYDRVLTEMEDGQILGRPLAVGSCGFLGKSYVPAFAAARDGDFRSTVGAGGVLLQGYGKGCVPASPLAGLTEIHSGASAVARVGGAISSTVAVHAPAAASVWSAKMVCSSPAVISMAGGVSGSPPPSLLHAANINAASVANANVFIFIN